MSEPIYFGDEREASPSADSWRTTYAQDYGRVYTGTSRNGPNWARVAVGATVSLVALAISLGTYAQASAGGGTYVVFWGAVVWGGWMALKGLAGK